MIKVKRFRIALCCAAASAVLLQAPPISGSARDSRQTENVPPAKTGAPQDPGAQSYAQHCAICHGEQRQGNLPGFPPLLGISHRMTNDQITELIHSGKGRMPGFPSLQSGEVEALLHFLETAEPAAQVASNSTEHTSLSAAGEALFQQNCAFCHGRDAQGGETGPDLTQSRLVRRDRTGDDIAKVIHEGRPNNKMPAFNFSTQEVRSIIAFIHAREAEAVAHPGGRRGVAVADLQTGNVDAGKRYFDGSGGCNKCHSPTGDLAGIASKFEGLELEERMLYPRDATSRVTVTLPSGEKFSGVLAYRDEFTVALRDANGIYRSWPAGKVHATVDAPVEAHVALFSKYTDDDIHNLMAYLQTLR
ncbi:MAG TPA: c-type cytochrome [Acidobacteriaceae bacterium]|nr:c-type cytochrome [Acidobacteriaceae bacterium]